MVLFVWLRDRRRITVLHGLAPSEATHCRCERKHADLPVLCRRIVAAHCVLSFRGHRVGPRSSVTCPIDPPSMLSLCPTRLVAGQGRAFGFTPRTAPSKLNDSTAASRGGGVGHTRSRMPGCPQRRSSATIRCAAGRWPIQSRLGTGVPKSRSVSDAAGRLCDPTGGLTNRCS